MTDAPALPTDDLRPVRVHDRALLPDLLRGLALFGILIVNMQDFAGFDEWTQHGLDRLAQILSDVLANGRFISLFAMLFGWGAAGIWERAVARGDREVFWRRHLLLILIGALHYVLLWHGDIIHNYAFMALLLPLMLRLRTRGVLLIGLVGGLWFLAVSGQDILAGLAYVQSPRSSYLPELAGMSYLALVAQRGREFPAEWFGGNLYFGPWLLLLFSLGVAAQRLGVLSKPEEHRGLLQRLRFWGLLWGLSLGVVLAWLNTRPDYLASALALPVRMVGGLAGALGYLGFLGLLLVRRHLGLWRLFAANGRLALSHYLMQSLIMTSLFYPYAGAQFGHWGAASTLILALAVGLGQLILSQWWLRHFRQGPAEALLRLLIYRRYLLRNPP